MKELKLPASYMALSPEEQLSMAGGCHLFSKLYYALGDIFGYAGNSKHRQEREQQSEKQSADGYTVPRRVCVLYYSSSRIFFYRLRNRFKTLGL